MLFEAKENPLTRSRSVFGEIVAKRRPVSTCLILAALTAASGAGFAVETASVHNADGRDAVVISEEERPAFLRYAKGQKMQPALSINRVIVGDVLPEYGVTYYALPLWYGHPFYRYAAIGAETVIVDRFTGVVIQVLE